MRRVSNKAQSFISYTLLIAVSAAALIMMHTYFVRAMQGKIRSSVDVFGQGEQYAKGETKVLTTDSSTRLVITEDKPAVSCSTILAKIDALNLEINGYDDPAHPGDSQYRHLGLKEEIGNLETSLGKMGGAVTGAVGLGGAQANMPITSDSLRDQAVSYKAEQDKLIAADNSQALVLESRAKECYDLAGHITLLNMSSRNDYGYWELFYQIKDEKSLLVSQGVFPRYLDLSITVLRSKGKELNDQAKQLRADAERLRTETEARVAYLNKAADDMDANAGVNNSVAVTTPSGNVNSAVSNLSQQLVKLNATLQAKKDEIAGYKNDYPACFLPHGG